MKQRIIKIAQTSNGKAPFTEWLNSLDNFKMERLAMKEYKYTLDLENYLIENLKSDKDIKLYLNASLKDYLEDGDYNSFCRALEIVIKAKDSVSRFAKKIGMSRTHLYSLFRNEKEPKFSTIIKIFRELGYELEIA